jgi:hypothetical protein
MNDDFALACHECGCVTIFQSDAASPRRCARCTAVLQRHEISSRMTPTRPIAPLETETRGSRSEASPRKEDACGSLASVDWRSPRWSHCRS